MGKAKRVCLSTNDGAVGRMFFRRGFEIVGPNDPSPDLICFTGGEDINPALYNENPLPRTYFNKIRDEREIELFNKFPNVPRVGICRG